MSKGLLQQIDTPQNLYDMPNNLFVAGFIGSPAMNFFKATIRRGDGKLFVDGGAFKVQIPDKKTETYAHLVDRPVIFGIRPEDIKDPNYLPPGIFAQPVEAKVDVTELMGNEIFLYLSSGDHSYVARVDPRTQARMGDAMQVDFNMDNMHIFDPDTEQAVR
jgi:multiple sugar transport system ATP-binding protein